MLDVAQDYSNPRSARASPGSTRRSARLAGCTKGAIWLGRTGKALIVDTAFRSVPGEQLADFAELLSKAVEKQNDGRQSTRCSQEMR